MQGKTEDRIARIMADLRPATRSPRPETAAFSLAQRMAAYATPGIGVAVIDGGRVAWERGFGLREAGKVAAVEADTLFQAGSISKLVFALGVMRLVEAGKLTLDDDVERCLASWRIPSHCGWTPRLTLRQLLSHRAGTNVHGFPGYPVTGPWPTLAQVLNGQSPANTPAIEVDLIPGLQFRYSGGGTTIAQAAVTDALGQALPALMDELVFRPLQLRSSTFAQPLPDDLALRAATAHPWCATPLQGGWRVYPELAAAGLWTTAGDLARIALEYLRALQGLETSLGLSAANAAEMLRPQAHDDADADEYVGLAWWIQRKGGVLHCSHSGWNEGFVAGLWLSPDAGKGAAVMINSNQGEALAEEVKAAITREYDWPQPKLEEIVAPVLVEGQYRTRQGLVCALKQSEGQVSLQIDAQPPLVFRRVGSSFAADAVNATFVVATGEDGRPALTLTQADRRFRFEKIG